MTAENCGRCIFFVPDEEALNVAREIALRIRVLGVNTKEEREIVERYGDLPPVPGVRICGATTESAKSDENCVPGRKFEERNLNVRF